MWGGIKQPIDKPPSPFIFYYSKMKITKNLVLAAIAAILLIAIAVPEARDFIDRTVNPTPGKEVTFTVNVYNPGVGTMYITSATYVTGGSCNIRSIAPLTPIWDSDGKIQVVAGKYASGYVDVTLGALGSTNRPVTMCLPSGSTTANIRLFGTSDNIISEKTLAVTV